MARYEDLEHQRIENSLSRLGALVSLACEDAARAEKNAKVAKERLYRLQKEVEQLYVTLGEPFIL